ncbi:MAG: sugar phosphate nucleotidyltransferase [Bacteroidales bacterium]
MKPTLLILAAGMGSRYGGLKQVDPLGPGGEAIIDYSIFDAIRAGFGKVVFVIRKSFAEAFKQSLDKKLKGKIETAYVYQELDSFVPASMAVSPARQKPWGTGHAVLVAKNVVHEPFVVINADDFYGPKSYKILFDYLMGPDKGAENHYSMVGYGLENTLSEFGSVSRGVCQTNQMGFLKTVVEHTHIERVGGNIINKPDENNIMELTGKEIVSMNIWGFQPNYFEYLETYFTRFVKENATNPKAEFYIPFVVNDLIKKELIKLKVLQTPDQWFGITYKEDRENAVARIEQLIHEGVYPSSLW